MPAAGFGLLALLLTRQVWFQHFDISRALSPLLTLFLLSLAVRCLVGGRSERASRRANNKNRWWNDRHGPDVRNPQRSRSRLQREPNARNDCRQDSVLAGELDLEVVMVDDGSADDSWEIMKRLAEDDQRIKAIRHPHNRGKGAAIRTAIDAMTGDIAIVQDADLEYDPAEYEKLIGTAARRPCRCRVRLPVSRAQPPGLCTSGTRSATRCSRWLFNVITNLNLTDMETCYKAVRADVLKELRSGE